MTKTEALKCLSILKASYPRQELGRDTLEAYAAMLADIDFEAAQDAVRRLICGSKWFPSIAEIRAEVAQAAMANMPAPEIAWGEVWKAISRYGMNRQPQFSCPEVAAAVDVIGWRTICLDENVASSRSRFIDAYRSYHDGSRSAAQLGQHAIGKAELGERKGYQPLRLVDANGRGNR